MGWLTRWKRKPPTEAERRFYAEVVRLDLSLFEDERFVRDRTCERLGTLKIKAKGRPHLETSNSEVRSRFRRAMWSGKVEIPVGGMTEDGCLWDGAKVLDLSYTPNVLVWLCAWNEVGVFSRETQRALTALLKEHGITTALTAG